MTEKKQSFFNEIVTAIKATQSGQERNMYPYIKQLFVNAFGYKNNQIFTDIQGTSGRGIPDLVVKVFSGAKGHDKKELMLERIVIEVKDEPGVFLQETSRNAIFKEKSKYISIDTTHFVMIDPACIIIRPLVNATRGTYGADTVIELDDNLKLTDLKQKAMPILAENTNIDKFLSKFRAGDVSTIAIVKLNGETTRADFFSTLRNCSSILQASCLEALKSHENDIIKIESLVNKFKQKYEDCEISFSPLFIKGKKYQIPSGVGQHARDVNVLKQEFSKNMPLARLAVQGIPTFQERSAADKNKLMALFSIETANLIFARILMLRFLEDHGFFGDKKYVCNGGVAAFQEIIKYFQSGYTKLLKEAYEKASAFYHAVFDESELDWVFGSNNQQLSGSIELAMYFLSRFDFSTVRGDILSGIYDRFLEGSQRKNLGEYYTPPSIARYIVDAVSVTPETMVFDPACGSGTFLIEAYQKMAGDNIERGIAGYNEVISALSKIAGNDINPLSAVIAQMQILWHIFYFKNDLKENGFPNIRITEKTNSLVQPAFDSKTFFDLDVSDYDAVIGNPPYVRPERLNQVFDESTRNFFSMDISPDMNLYCLFVYRALMTWCKKPENGQQPGRLGFVLPLSFCDTEESSKLRQLFMPGGKWTILQIVDMEFIAPYVFDAAVNPIIFIAENRPAKEDDTVIIKIAGKECVVTYPGESARPTFDLNKATSTTFSYKNIFTKNGRILTKITETRLEMCRKIGNNKKFEDIVDTIWVRKEKGKIVSWQKNKPPSTSIPQNSKWEEIDLLRRGAVFRGGKVKASDTGGKGFDIYKGENIAACLLEGDPQETDIDVDKMDDPALWRFRDVLPNKGYAFLQICLSPCCVAFDFSAMVLMDTSTLFFPKELYKQFPFDLLVLSRIYRYYHGLILRQGVVEDLWSHLYPLNLRLIPWTDKLLDFTNDIESLRNPFITACRNIHKRSELLMEKLSNEIDSVAFKEAAAKLTDVWVKWGASFEKESTGVTIAKPAPSHSSEPGYSRLNIGEDLFAYLDINNESLANRLSCVLDIYVGQKLSKRDILDLLMPSDEEAYNNFEEIIRATATTDSVDDIYDKLDDLVGKAYGLDDSEIKLIQKEMKEDDFLKRLQPKLPFAKKKMRGFLAGLDSSDRYN